MKKGLFIVLEGLDGSGSSTQCELLKNYLEVKGEKVLLTKEPTNNLVGGLIRGVLTSDWNIGPNGLQLLFCADRAHHLEKEIIPAIEQGITIICDRYLFSTLAFGALDCGMDWLKKLNEKFLLPDLTLILDLSASDSIKRIAKGRSRFELFEKEEKLEAVSLNYKKLAKEYENVLLIDANRDREIILRDIAKNVEEYYKKIKKN